MILSMQRRSNSPPFQFTIMKDNSGAIPNPLTGIPSAVRMSAVHSITSCGKIVADTSYQVNQQQIFFWFTPDEIGKSAGLTRLENGLELPPLPERNQGYEKNVFKHGPELC